MGKGDENLKPFDFGSSHPATAQSAEGGVPGWLVVILILLMFGGGGAAYLFYIDRDLGRQLLGNTPLEPAATVTTAYKWKDSDGNWQITDRPPPEGTPYQTLNVSSDANVVPSFKPQDN